MSYRHQLNFDSTTPIYPTPFPKTLRPIKEPPVHTLWRCEAFLSFDLHSARGTDDSEWEAPQSRIAARIYRRMVPALRLATILLYRAKSQLMRIMFAPHLLPLNSLDPTWAAPADASDRFDRELVRIARYYRILRFSTQRIAAYAITGMPRSDINRRERRPVIGGLAADFYDTIQANDWNTRDPHRRAATLLSLASILVHELAHVIWNDRNQDNIRAALLFGRQLEDPLAHPAAPYRELGQAVEEDLFGGRLHIPSFPDNGSVDLSTVQWDGSQGLAILVAPHGGNWSRAGGRPAWFLSPETLAGLFDERMWGNGQVNVLPLDLLSAPRSPIKKVRWTNEEEEDGELTFVKSIPVEREK